ncbi:MAG: hypothetical protein ACI4U9_02265 [Clostridia bacterium]
MFTNNERKIVVPKGWNVTEEEKPDGSRVFKFAQATHDDTTRHHQEGIFKLVPASKLSLNDDFLKYSPKTPAEVAFMVAVKIVIETGVQDFYRPTLDPSFDGEGGICYQAGMNPAVGKSYNWWYENSKKFCPKWKSRLGTRSEYIAFLAVLIKEMVASGKSLGWAWNAVCNDSKELGHYWNSNDAKHAFEATGNREVCGWRDLANTFKILVEDNELGLFCLASGDYDSYGYSYPLADLFYYICSNNANVYSTGWLVLS